MAKKLRAPRRRGGQGHHLRPDDRALIAASVHMALGDTSRVSAPRATAKAPIAASRSSRSRRAPAPSGPGGGLGGLAQQTSHHASR